MILIRAPAKKPKNAPNADRVACLSVLLASNSPKSAPTKGPIIIPGKLKMIIPKKEPKNAPATPNLLALYFLAPKVGRMKSKANTMIVIPKKTRVVVKEIFAKFVETA